MKYYITTLFNKNIGVMFTKANKAFDGDVWIQYDLQIFLWSTCITLNYNRFTYIMTEQQKRRLKSLINKPRMAQ